MGKKKTAGDPDQKDVAAIQDYLDWIDQAPAILKGDLEKIIEFILSAGEAYLPVSKLSESDKEFRQCEIKQLDELREILRILDLDIADKFLKTKIWRAVNLAMIAGNNLAQYGEPIPAVKGEVFSQNARKMRADKAAKKAPEIATRRELLAGSGYDLNRLAIYRKESEAVEGEFGKICEASGIKRPSGKTIQNDAREILKERQNYSGNS